MLVLKLPVVRATARVRCMAEWRQRLHKCRGKHSLLQRKASNKIAKWQRAAGRRKEAKSQDGIHTITTIQE